MRFVGKLKNIPHMLDSEFSIGYALPETDSSPLRPKMKFIFQPLLDGGFQLFFLMFTPTVPGGNDAI